MATLRMLEDSGVIVRIDPGLEPNELINRCLYGTTDFMQWLENELPNIEYNPMYADLTPMEQVAAMFSEYVTGMNFSTDRRFKKLNRTPSFNVWELKTEDVRIFGWVPQKDHFICACADSAPKIKQHDLYEGYMGQTKRVMDGMDLDEPKYLEGMEYSDVISNEN